MANTIFQRTFELPFSDDGDGIVEFRNITADDWILFLQESAGLDKKSVADLARFNVKFARSLITDIQNVEFGDRTPLTLADVKYVPMPTLRKIVEFIENIVRVSGKK